MPTLLRAKENTQTPLQIQLVTPELMKRLILQGKTGTLIPSTLTLTDSGEATIRPALRQLAQ